MEIRQRLKSLTSDKSFQTITLIFTAFVAFKLYFLIFPVDVIVPEQATAFSWPWVILIIALGYLGYFISLRLDIARIWDVNVSNFKRFGIPAITGFIYGVITVFNDYREHAHHPHQTSDKVHVVFPQSIVFYSYGDIFLEVFLRLFGISFLVWLFSHVILQRRFETVIFWIAAVITSWWEIGPYVESYSISEVAGGVFSWLFISNMVEAYEFKKYGFWAPLVFRFVFYMVWHVIWGSLITQS